MQYLVPRNMTWSNKTIDNKDNIMIFLDHNKRKYQSIHSVDTGEKCQVYSSKRNNIFSGDMFVKFSHQG